MLPAESAARISEVGSNTKYVTRFCVQNLKTASFPKDVILRVVFSTPLLAKPQEKAPFRAPVGLFSGDSAGPRAFVSEKYSDEDYILRKTGNVAMQRRQIG